MKESNRGEYDLLHWGVFLFAGTVVSAFITPYALPLVFHWGVAAGSGAILKVGYTKLVRKEGKEKDFVNVLHSTPATYDQSGWNWSEDPTKKSTRKYQALKKAIQLNPTASMVQENQKFMDRISKKIRKLKEQIDISVPLFTHFTFDSDNVVHYGNTMEACGFSADLLHGIPAWECVLHSDDTPDEDTIIVRATNETEAKPLCIERLQKANQGMTDLFRKRLTSVRPSSK